MREIVGVDCGTTLTKFAWWKRAADGSYTGDLNFASTADRKISAITKDLLASGIKTAFVTGINRKVEIEKLLEPIIVAKVHGNPIESELNLQVLGARKLLKMSDSQPKECELAEANGFLLVGVGTGVSYTIARPEKNFWYPYGSGLGGGFIDGIMNLAGICPYLMKDPYIIKDGKISDIKIEDILPETAGSFRGGLSIAHFGNMKRQGGALDVIKTTLHCVAANILRDILQMDTTRIPEWKPPWPVVFVGSTVGRFHALQKMLKRGFENLESNLPEWKHEAIFPPHAEYAGAIGALYYGQ